MNYTDVSQHFSHFETVNNLYTRNGRGTKEFYLRAGHGASLPTFLKVLNSYLLLCDKVVYIPSHERITRSTDVRYMLRTLTQWTRVQVDTDQDYNLPLLYSNLQIDAFNLKDICAIHLVEVVGQIQETFEHFIPEWARDCEATEQLGISLALKITPKHRIRVYVRDKHIIVFTTKGISDSYETDCMLYRKLWACLPILRNWIEDEEHPEVVELCKALDKSDSKIFWDLIEQCFNNNPVVKDLKYSTIIQTFNNIVIERQAMVERQITEHNVNASRWLEEYSKALTAKREAERWLLEIQNSDSKFETDTIKMLVDKKICYALDISRITNGDGAISYRCATPLLSYDKDAARVVYNKRVKPLYSKYLAQLFKILFIDEKAILLFDQAITVKLNRGSYTARSGETYLRVDLNQSFPNPHHYYYNCWGSYGPTMVRLIQEYKLEELFYQVKAAMSSLNFSDPPVIGRFLSLLEEIIEGDYNPPCIYWRDENCTTLHTISETLEHFKNEEAVE